MLTIVVRDRIPLLGTLAEIPHPHIIPSALGQTILDNEIYKISKVHPNVEVWQTCLMPDHIHMILRVVWPFAEKKHLGNVIAGFKSGCNNAFWNLGGSRGNGLFAPNYNDRILGEQGQYLHWKRHLDENPLRLHLKRTNPNFFTSISDFNLFNINTHIFGNRFLLDIPAKAAVIFHSRYSDKEFRDLCNHWLDIGETGGVLVSPAIHPMEKMIMREAITRSYNIILLRDNGFPPIYKPSGEAFYACSEGRLLQISPWPYTNRKVKLSRPQCLYLNQLAETIAAHPTSH